MHQLAASNTRFPAPVARVATGPLWTVPAIEHFNRIWERKPGRPHRTQEPELAWPAVAMGADLVVIDVPPETPDEHHSAPDEHLQRRRA